MDNNAEIRLRGRNYEFSDPYNLIHYTVSFLSRSTQESGLSKKKEEENHNVKTIEEACKTQTKNE